MGELDWIVEVNTQDELIGRVRRNIAHRVDNLLLHREVMVLLYADSGRDRFVLQHRSPNKRQLPGYWTLSATGHVDHSDISHIDPEGYLSAARRETKEELGVSVKNLKLITKIEQKLPINWSIMGLVVGEFEGQFDLDPAEVSEVRVFDRKSITEIGDKITPGARACLAYLNII